MYHCIADGTNGHSFVCGVVHVPGRFGIRIVDELVVIFYLSLVFLFFFNKKIPLWSFFSQIFCLPPRPLCLSFKLPRYRPTV